MTSTTRTQRRYDHRLREMVCNIKSIDAAEGAEAKPFIPFKSSITGGIGGIFEKAFHFFKLHRDAFDSRYHQRSNVESTFSMCKAKLGDSVRSKTDTAMKNEVLAKFVCHNICCLISAMYELGITPEFAQAV